MTWKPELGTQVLVLDKDDLSKRRVFELPPFFFFHLGDAWEETDGTIRFDACVDDDPSGTAANGGAILRGEQLRAAPPRRALITLRADGRGEIAKEAVSAEFPRGDARFAGQARRYSVHVTNERPDRPLFQGVAVRDWKKPIATRSSTSVRVTWSRRWCSCRVPALRRNWTAGWSARRSIWTPRRQSCTSSTRAVSSKVPIAAWRAPVALPVTFHGVFAQT
jgi:all-trans-8'-apo-beta-carotenal 15,15'-oxygenase